MCLFVCFAQELNIDITGINGISSFLFVSSPSCSLDYFSCPVILLDLVTPLFGEEFELLINCSAIMPCEKNLDLACVKAHRRNDPEIRMAESEKLA